MVSHRIPIRILAARRRWAARSFAAVLLAYAGTSYAAGSAAPAAGRALAQFAPADLVRGDVEEGTIWRDAESGLIRRFVPGDRNAYGGARIAGPVSKSAGTAVAAADAVLAAQSKMLGLAAIVPELEVSCVREGLASAHVRYRRVIGGHEVIPGGVGVHLSLDGRPLVTGITLDPRLSADGALPRIGEIEAVARALAAAVPGAGGVNADLVYREGSDGLLLTWRVRFFCEAPLGDWEIWIDAASGEEILRLDRALHAEGTGTVWTPNPVNVLETDNLLDRGDADDPSFDGAYTDVALRDLDDPVGGQYFLSGPWVHITDDENPPGGIPSAGDADGFRTTRQDDLFEAVMVYYHIDESQRYLQSLGFTGDKGIADFSIGVDPHGLSGTDNSHYVPSEKRLAFGDGNVDDAEDADVVVHEYGHAMQDDQAPGWLGVAEMGAMGEGFCDYWAESYTARIGITYGLGQVFDWDRGPVDGFWDGRRVDTDKVYPDDLLALTQIHLNGEIWSGALWDIREVLGGETTDRTVVESHFFIDIPADFEAGALAVISADQALSGGANEGVIFGKFYDRGILSGSMLAPTLSEVAAPETIQQGDSLKPYLEIVTSNPIVEADLVYSIDGSEEDTMALAREGLVYSAVLPLPDSTDQITYYYFVEDATGLVSRSPTGAPGDRHVTNVGAGPASAAFTVSPDPFDDQLAITIRLNGVDSPKLSIYSLSGRRVREFDLQDSGSPKGMEGERTIPVTWDGTNDAGLAVPSGVYFLRLEAGNLTDSRKVTYLAGGVSDTMVRTAGPNPFVGSISFALDLPRQGDLRFTIYDLAGREVAQIAEGNAQAGRSVVTWDGRNSVGKQVAQGIYFYRLTLDGLEERGRIVHLRHPNE